MKNTADKNRKNPVNIIAVILAFILGLSVGSLGTKNEPLTPHSSGEGSVLTRREPAGTSTEATRTTKESANEISFTVYITPTGERYHLNPDCAGENKLECKLEEATAKGLTPCKSCADG